MTHSGGQPHGNVGDHRDGMRQMRDWKSVVVVNSVSVALTWAFVALIRTAVPDQPPLPWTEIIATATALSCVWLTRIEDELCWPIGIVSSALMGWTYFGYDLPGQAWLNLLYFTPVQFYGWWMWRRRIRYGATLWSDPVVRVSTLRLDQTFASIGCAFFATALLGSLLFHFYGGILPQRWWDSSIVVASIVAQWLLNRKRVEAWWWWLIPVNVSSVILFWHQGAYLYSLMYVVFGVHAAIAIRDWRKTCQPA
jgi:nicotinamide mononucleotide transporter